MDLFNLLGIGTAYAATGGEPSTQGSLISLLPMLVIFILVFYFLLLRPQQKRAKEQRQLIENLAKGDEIVTAGGIAGKITKIDEHFLVITIADNVNITVQKSAVSNVLPKGTLKSIES